jgi:hypothetical protein
LPPATGLHAAPDGDMGPPEGCLPDGEEPAHEAPPKKEGEPNKWQPMYSVYGPSCWVDGEYLWWHIKPMAIPEPLLTTGLPTTPPSAGFGILGNPSTTILFGQNDVGFGGFDGARVTVGGWLDGGYRPPGCKPIGAEVSYMVLGRQSTHFSASSEASGLPLLGRPVVDALTGSETSLLVSAPMKFGGSTGAFTVDADSEMWGAEANIFMPFCGLHHLMAGGLLGVRYINFEENLSINQDTTVLPGGTSFFVGVPVGAGSRLAISDEFETRNNFYGGQVGAQAAVNWWRFSVSAVAKVALGTMTQQVKIMGQTTLNAPGTSATASGGLLALPSNSGDFNQAVFAVVPEGTAHLTFEVTDKIHLMAGYTFIYIDNVIRPGNQIDRTINPTQLPVSASFTPGPAIPARPAFDFARTEFWMHGLTVGLALAF